MIAPLKTALRAEVTIPPEFKGESTVAVCMLKLTNTEDGGDEFVTYLLTIDDGRVSKYEKLNTAYSASDAINDATDYLDDAWWER